MPLYLVRLIFTITEREIEVAGARTEQAANRVDDEEDRIESANLVEAEGRRDCASGKKGRRAGGTPEEARGGGPGVAKGGPRERGHGRVTEQRARAAEGQRLLQDFELVQQQRKCRGRRRRVVLSRDDEHESEQGES